LTAICTKSFVHWGFVLDHTGEAFSAPQTPELYLGGLLLEREEEREGREGVRLMLYEEKTEKSALIPSSVN